MQWIDKQIRAIKKVGKKVRKSKKSAKKFIKSISPKKNN